MKYATLNPQLLDAMARTSCQSESGSQGDHKQKIFLERLLEKNILIGLCKAKLGTPSELPFIAIRV